MMSDKEFNYLVDKAGNRINQIEQEVFSIRQDLNILIVELKKVKEKIGKLIK